MSDFQMPALGASMDTGTLVRWLKKPGDSVRRGDIIAVVDTEKGAIEIEVFEDGVITDLVVAPGTSVPVGTVLARIEVGEAVHEAHKPPRRAVSPAARRRAAELHVDLAAIEGTGPDGAVTLQDVEQRAARPLTPDSAAPRPSSEPLVRPSALSAEEQMRHAIATAMARSKREIPHAYLSTLIDVTPALEWMTASNTQRPVTERLLPAALLLRATILAVSDVPEVNGHFFDGRARTSEAVHVGVAIALRTGGLIAPAIRDAQALDLDGVMRNLANLVTRVRGGTLHSSDLADATLTVTNLGDQGVDTVLGVIVPPQLVIVGFGRIIDRPWVVDERVVVRRAVTASVSFDHRALDGHRAGLFLAAIERRLHRPEAL